MHLAPKTFLVVDKASLILKCGTEAGARGKFQNTYMSLQIGRALILVTFALSNICAEETAATHRILERGPHHKVVATGEGTKYTELRTGMHYFKSGAWLETEELIIKTETGAEATRGPYRIQLANHLSASDPIDITTSDNKRLLPKLLGLRYFDAGTGAYVPISSTKDSVLEILPPNRAIYRDICDGVKADLLLTYSSGTLECDFVLRSRPPSPEIYGLDPSSTRLEVVTEFKSPPPTHAS